MTFYFNSRQQTPNKHVTTNTVTDRRNNWFVFTTNNNCEIDLNIPSSVSNIIEKEQMESEKYSFKLKAKIQIVQKSLDL